MPFYATWAKRGFLMQDLSSRTVRSDRRISVVSAALVGYQAQMRAVQAGGLFVFRRYLSCHCAFDFYTQIGLHRIATDGESAHIVLAIRIDVFIKLIVGADSTQKKRDHLQ